MPLDKRGGERTVHLELLHNVTPCHFEYRCQLPSFHFCNFSSLVRLLRSSNFCPKGLSNTELGAVLWLFLICASRLSAG